MKVTVLGCGGSGGVPMIGPVWGACDPKEPKNRRRRVSILVEEADTRILVDTSPDLRAQLLDAGINDLTAIVWTHHHADHMNGIDDLRPLNRFMKKPLDVYGSAETLAHIERSFGYVFKPVPAGGPYYKPHLIPHAIQGPFQVGHFRVTPFEQDHGYGNKTLGFRIGNCAYSTDVKALDERAFGMLGGLDLWIVDCLRDEPHPTHSHFAQTMDWIRRVQPKRAVLTHMSHEADYATWKMRLPPHVEPGYDGLVVQLDEVRFVDRDPGGYYVQYMRDEAPKP